MRSNYKALLIQDIRELLNLLRPIVRQGLSCVKQPILYEDSVILWIIKEIVERNYYLVDQEHQVLKESHLHQHMYQFVRMNLQQNLDVVVSYWIKTPKLYGDDTMVHIWMKGIDLYIGYNVQ